jgi:diguanylate cyclase (GGDEF)-like protein
MKEAGTALMELVRRLGTRITDLADWRDPDKCILASVLTLPFVALWIVRLTIARVDPATGAYLEPGAVGPMLAFVWFQAAGYLVIIATSWALRARWARARWLVHSTIQFWFVCYFLDLYAIGPYTSPFVMLLLVFPVLGFILLGIRPVALGLATFGVLLVASTIAERLALLPYAPLIVSDPFVDGRPHTTWILSLGAIPMLAATLILAIFAHVIVQWRNREEELRELCKIDYLTGVHNRRSFMELADLEFARARRYEKALAVVIVDVDHFKRVNDDHGHSVGDEVLKLVAKILAAEVRRYDVAARYGGEEFAILLAETNEEQARVMAERCREQIEGTELVMKGSTVRVTASIGIAAYPRDGVTRIEQLIDLADQALYRAKESGRNRIAVAA